MITRFAPSPTGPLHLGHAFSALTVWSEAARAGGKVLLRIEDVDTTRSRPEFIEGIIDDLRWLGLDWPTPVRQQSQCLDDYARVIEALVDRGLVYPCACTRRDITEAGGKPGFEGIVYPGTCMSREMSGWQPGEALRLNLVKALEQMPALPGFHEVGPVHAGHHPVSGRQLVTGFGDPVLRRRENADASYLLACTHDDAAQGITHVIRGLDLWNVTGLQVLLQALMGWPQPIYYHHDLIRDGDGRKLAKIDRSKALSQFRSEGLSANDIRRLTGFPEV